MDFRSLRPALHCSLVAAVCALALPACSGSGSDSPATISALTAPTGVSVVEADESAVSTGGTLPGAGSAFPADSAFVADAASVQIFDPSVRGVATANQILCEVAQTRFWRFVNEPPYNAQVDSRLCGNSSDTDDVQSLIHLFTMDVDRASNDAPQTAQLWLDLEESGTPVTINALLQVDRAPGAGDRYGQFQLTYAGVPDGGSVADPVMFGVLESEAGAEGFTFLEGSGDTTVPAGVGEQARLVQVALERSSSGPGGAALIRSTVRSNDGSGDATLTTDWRVVFDQTHVLRQLGAQPAVALSRGNFRNHVYAYNLYEASGADIGDRVELNAGINVEMPNGAYGWVGYHGAWAPPSTSFTDGMIVTANDGADTYTVVRAPGRLLRRTRSELALASLGTQRFSWWDSGAVSLYQVSYTGAVWQRVAEWNNSTSEWDELMTPTTVDTAAEGVLDLHSSFIGNVRFVHGDAAVTYFETALVNGSDPIFTGLAQLELFAMIGGLRSEITQMQVEGGDVHLATPMTGSSHRYVIDPTDMTLILDVNGDGSVMQAAGLATGIEPTAGPNTWGMRSGPMLLAADAMSTTDAADYFAASTHYVYETGHNPWNQFVGLVDGANAYVTFDRPIEFLYVHSTAADMNGDASFDGQQILLQYNGPGKLFGIPGEDLDLGGGERRYVPSFSIADGTLLGPSSEYVLRAIGVEQTLEVDPGFDGTDGHLADTFEAR
ncbi:MAG: hypothetical protein AAFR54_14390, partial [Planctomycetota bacterium]